LFGVLESNNEKGVFGPALVSLFNRYWEILPYTHTIVPSPLQIKNISNFTLL